MISPLITRFLYTWKKWAEPKKTETTRTEETHDFSRGSNQKVEKKYPKQLPPTPQVLGRCLLFEEKVGGFVQWFLNSKRKDRSKGKKFCKDFFLTKKTSSRYVIFP